MGFDKRRIALVAGPACLAANAHAQVVDHGDGNFTASGTFVPALPYLANGGTDSTPTISIDASTYVEYGSISDDFFSINAADYLVEMEPGALIRNINVNPIFTSTVPGTITTYHIAGKLEGAGPIIAVVAVPSSAGWDLDLSGTIRGTYVNIVLLGQGLNDKLTLQSTGVLGSANGG